MNIRTISYEFGQTFCSHSKYKHFKALWLFFCIRSIYKMIVNERTECCTCQTGIRHVMDSRRIFHQLSRLFGQNSGVLKSRLSTGAFWCRLESLITRVVSKLQTHLSLAAAFSCLTSSTSLWNIMDLIKSSPSSFFIPLWLFFRYI